MSIPLKPWEMSGFSPAVTDTPYVSNTGNRNMENRLYSSAVPFPGTSGGSTNSTNPPRPPPVPPRPDQQQAPYSAYNRQTQMYNPYSGMYGGVGAGAANYYNYNPYGTSYTHPMGFYGGAPRPMGMYGGSVNPYGHNEITFSQLAEESSAGAFQSIESFVSAFGSISAMLESTFQAVYSSFRAVVGVADHLGRVKQVFSALAIFRFMRWCYRRILYLIGLSKIKPEQIESLWNSASNELDGGDWTESQLRPRRKPSSWPILMFLGFIFAGPYLMWKLLASLNLKNSAQADTKWASGEAEHFIASAEYDFESGMSERELNLKRGQRIRLAPSAQQPPELKGWVLASDGVKIGLVPTNYIKIIGKRAANPVPIRITSASNNLMSSHHSRLANSSPQLCENEDSQNQNNSNHHANNNIMTTSTSSASDSETLKAASRSSSTSSLFNPTTTTAHSLSAQQQQQNTQKFQSQPDLHARTNSETDFTTTATGDLSKKI